MSEILIHCPYVVCRKILFRRIKVFRSEDDYIEQEGRCPHCGNTYKERVGSTITVKAIK